MVVSTILQLVTDIWDNKHNIGIKTIVADDDTKMQANLKHAYKDMIDAGTMNKVDWPRTKSGHKKKDTGKLPLRISEPTHLSDPSHRIKIVGKHVYDLATKPKKISCVTKADAKKIFCVVVSLYVIFLCLHRLSLVIDE